MDAPPEFTQLVDMHYAPLYRFALSLSRQPSTAEDLTQQTFLQWARKGSTLRDATKAKTWLFTTLYREWLGVARRESRFVTEEFNEETAENTVEEVAEETGPVDAALVMDSLGRLPETYRAPVVLFYMKEMAYRDIAEVLDIPLGTVMSRLSRGKDLLRKELRAAMAAENRGEGRVQ
jgi:RNA polymerase sigma factor (sigma-70 family)